MLMHNQRAVTDDKAFISKSGVSLHHAAFYTHSKPCSPQGIIGFIAVIESDFLAFSGLLTTAQLGCTGRQSRAEQD
jgi:hypothetical protein